MFQWDAYHAISGGIIGLMCHVVFTWESYFPSEQKDTCENSLL